MKNLELTKEEKKFLNRSIADMKKKLVKSRLSEAEAQDIDSVFSKPEFNSLRSLKWYLTNSETLEYYSIYEIPLGKDTDGKPFSIRLRLNVDFSEDYCLIFLDENRTSNGLLFFFVDHSEFHESIFNECLPEDGIRRLPEQLKNIYDSSSNLVSSVENLFEKYDSEGDGDKYDRVYASITARFHEMLGKPKRCVEGKEKVNIIHI
jgi:hypothetical protein